MDLREAIESIWECKRQGIYYPSQWKGALEVEEGYQVQLGILKKEIEKGDTQTGWKVGLTGAAIQQQVAYHEPVFGYLMQSGALASGAVVPFNDLVAPCVEIELCLKIGTTLQGPGVDYPQARAAISGVSPGIELVERRGDFAGDPALSMADNVQQKYYVTAEATHSLPEDLSLSEIMAEIYINGEKTEQALGSEVLGDPVNSLVWLANRLAEFGHRLEAGMVVMSGSFTRQYPIAQGDLMEADFTRFGRVSVEFQ